MNDRQFYNRCDRIMQYYSKDNTIDLNIVIALLTLNKDCQTRGKIQKCIDYLEKNELTVLNKHLLDELYPKKIDKRILNVVTNVQNITDKQQLYFHNKCERIRLSVVDTQISLEQIKQSLGAGKTYQTKTKILQCIEYLESYGITVLDKEKLYQNKFKGNNEYKKFINSTSVVKCISDWDKHRNHINNTNLPISDALITRYNYIKSTVHNNEIYLEEIIDILGQNKQYKTLYYVQQCIDYLELNNIKVLNKELINYVFPKKEIKKSKKYKVKSTTISDEDFINIVNQNTSMLNAAKQCHMDYVRFKQRAISLNVFKSPYVNITDAEIIKNIENSKTMVEAAEKCNMSFTTFREHAMKLNVYKSTKKHTSVSDDVIIEAVKNSNTLKEAAEKCNMNYKSFCERVSRMRHKQNKISTDEDLIKIINETDDIKKAARKCHMSIKELYKKSAELGIYKYIDYKRDISDIVKLREQQKKQQRESKN